MKKILFLAGLLLTVATASAQATLDKGALQLNAKLYNPQNEMYQKLKRNVHF